ncbi:hypothetical protein ACFL6N_05040 [Thermodesulfobacteriota bacterium]
MRLRRILIIHGVRIFRNMLKHSILSEFSDAVVVEAAAADVALDYLESQQFSVIIADAGDIAERASATLETRKGKAVQPEVPVIAIIGPGAGIDSEALARKGVAHCLNIPFQPHELKTVINTACNPRSWRMDERFYIPEARVILHAKENDIEAQLINISKGGFLCAFDYQQQALDLLGNIRITLHISDPDFSFGIKNLPCKLLRLDTSTWKNNGVVEQLRVTFLFHDLPLQSATLLDQALSIAKERFDKTFSK